MHLQILNQMDELDKTVHSQLRDCVIHYTKEDGVDHKRLSYWLAEREKSRHVE